MIGTASEDTPAQEDVDDLGAPFGVELGGAAALPTGFAVAASNEEHGETHAIIAILQDDGRGRTVDLGPVHGDVAPPQVAARGERVFAAVIDHDASARVVRVARVDLASSKPALTTGPDIGRDSDDSPMYGLAIGADRGIVVWDDWDEKADHSVVRGASFAPDDLSHISEATKMSDENADAESPRVTERADGFWAAWIVDAVIDHKHKTHVEDDEVSPEDVGPQWIVIAPLDRAGIPHGHAVTVTPTDGHAQSFDLATAADGGALIVWRDEPVSRATAGGTIRLAQVHADGSVERRVLADDDVGSTVPTLLPDELTPSEPKARWVAFAADDETTRFGLLDAHGQPLKPLQPEASLLGGEPLAARDGKLLSAKAKGRRAELSVLSCRTH